jgi:hypothetical protein
MAMNQYARIETYAEEAEQIVECLQQRSTGGRTRVPWPEDERLRSIIKVAEDYLVRPMGQANYEWLMQDNLQR